MQRLIPLVSGDPDADRDGIISSLKSVLGPQFAFATTAGSGAAKTAVGVEKKYAKAADRHIDGRDFFSVVLMDGSAVIGGASKWRWA